MKILFLTLVKIVEIESQGIYTDLLRKFRDNGHEVTIVCPNERKHGEKTKFIFNGNVKILKVWTTNFQKTNLIEKGITTLLLEYFYYKAIKKFVKYKEVDLILYSTPPITFTNLIMRIKKASNAKTYLLLKDIFPQNAVDLNLFKKSSILFKYFRKLELDLYRISDFIGCMSPANLKYLLNENPEVDKCKVEVNPNSIEVKENGFVMQIDLYKKYLIPKDKIIFIFGGNLGKPQGVDCLKKNITYCKSLNEAFFLIIGNGTEYNNIKKWVKKEKLNNVLLIKELEKNEYDQILKLAHVGLIFLNPSFTIPNFPSRLLSYMQNSQPVICATDNITDIGDIAVENNFGYKCLTSDLEGFSCCVEKLLNNDLRSKMGINSYNYLIKEYDVQISYEKIVNKIH
jgi:glycosyltransferase involved in cell wall biosynthesis